MLLFTLAIDCIMNFGTAMIAFSEQVRQVRSFSMHIQYSSHIQHAINFYSYMVHQRFTVGDVDAT